MSGVGDLQAKRLVAFYSKKELMSPFPPLFPLTHLGCEASLFRNELCPDFGIYLATSLIWKRKSILPMVCSKGRSFSHSDYREYVFSLFLPLGVIQFHFFMVCVTHTLHLPNPRIILALIFLQLSFVVTQADYSFHSSQNTLYLAISD